MAKGLRNRTAKKNTSTGPSRKSAAAPVRDAAATPSRGLTSLFESLGDLASELTSSAKKLATLTRDGAARAIDRGPDQLRMMAAAGDSLRDLRELAGLTLSELSQALNLQDKSFLEAVEDGREVLSMELILRLASLVARNDPLPFIMKYARSYNPRLWDILQELKIDQLPLQFERERKFINIYRRQDAARALTDTDFERVLDFTQRAFDMAMHFVAATEQPTGVEPALSPTAIRRRRAAPSRRAPVKRSPR